jgi:IMP dehydrogenase
MKTGLSFDDVLLVPRKLTFSSRFNGEIDLSTQLLPNVKLKYPIVSANMDTVTEAEMADKMNELGGLGIVHRFMDAKRHKKELFSVREHRIVCIGVGTHSRERFDVIHDRPDRDNSYIQGVLIDVAHGHSNTVIERIREVKQSYPNLPIIAGNVATPQGVLDLLQAGADCIKVGVGPGSLCTTRVKTGCGVPQLTAIMAAKQVVEHSLERRLNWKPTIIADGGIKSSGDIIKALAAGADAVMVGNLFAGTDESPGRVVKFPGRGRMKEYRGMASQEAQESWKGRATSVEGEMTYVPYKGSLENVFNDVISGVLSGMSYQNASNLEELRENAEFTRITPASLQESLPHGVVLR